MRRAEGLFSKLGRVLPLFLSAALSTNSMIIVPRHIPYFARIPVPRQVELRASSTKKYVANQRDAMKNGRGRGVGKDWTGRNRDLSAGPRPGTSLCMHWSSSGSCDKEINNKRTQYQQRLSNQCSSKAQPHNKTKSKRTSSTLLLRQQFLSLSPALIDGGGLLVGVLLLAFGGLYFNQEKMLYLPEIDDMPRQNALNPPGYRSPSEYDIPFEEHWITTDDGVSIHSWLLLHPDSKERRLPTICFFHGNAGNIGIRIPNAKQMFDFLQCNVLMVEYRGYGDSDSVKPTEPGLKLDAEAAFRFIQEHPAIDPKRIFLFGRSLGGGVSFHVAQYAEKNGVPLAGMIVENTFISVGRMVDAIFPFLSPFKRLLLRMDWDSSKIAPTLKVPILYLAGESDEIVPFSHMQELYESSKSSSVRARIHVVKGGTHNETWIQGGRLYWETIRQFLSDILASERK